MANKTQQSPNAASGSDRNGIDSPKSSPMQAMAASARDKFQASAREIMKNFEEAMIRKPGNTAGANAAGNGNENPTASASSLENAIRAMFSSCTSGGADNVISSGVGEDRLELEESMLENRSYSSRSSSSRGRRKGKNSNGAGARILQTAKCDVPSSSAARNQFAPPLTDSSLYRRVSTKTNAATAQQDIGEHIYAQLFFDDQIRAAKAVNGHRGNDQAATTPKHAGMFTRTSTPPEASSKFDPSNPYKAGANAPITMSPFVPPPSMPLPAQEFDISANLTFDDSISAISAHTLEAMARNASMQSSRSDPTVSPSPVMRLHSNEERDQVHYGGATLGAERSPFAVSGFSRSQSHQTAGTKHSGSTRTTESSSFDNWHREEQKYWEDEALKDDTKGNKNLIMRGVRRQSRKSSGNSTSWRSGKSGGGGSSIRSGRKQSSRKMQQGHPHDALFLGEDEPVATVNTSRLMKDPSESSRRRSSYSVTRDVNTSLVSEI